MAASVLGRKLESSWREDGELRRADAFEILCPDLELASLVIVTEANRNDLAAVDAEWAAILDHDAMPLAASQA